MARQPYNVDTSQKKLEVFGSFGGGMVTQAHPEKLKNDQSVLLENIDIVDGGVIQNRGAYSQTNAGNITGNTQGRFKYVNLAGGQDIVAINGKLYTVVGNTYTYLPITGLSSFQASRTIEAVQLREKMYFATGSGIVEYDGTTATKLTAYTPTGLEALYIGTNGLAADPDNYISDTTGAGNVILGATVSLRYGVINTPITFTAYVQKVASDTLEYKFETKQTDALEWKLDKDWSTSKSLSKTFTTRAEYMVRITMRKQGTTIELSQYIIPRYKVNSVPEPKPEPTVNGSNLESCNRIFIHYDRLWIYGDTNNPDFLYISHLNKFTYFPRTNIIKCTDPLRGALNNVTRYKDFLVCFTSGSIQLITGTNPAEFVKVPLHTTLGTKFGYSIQIMKNSIVFAGNDNSIYILRSFNYASSDKLNVERIDDKIKDVIASELKVATKVYSAIYEDQYYLYIESGQTKHVYRFYYEMGVWVRDVLPFGISSMENVDNVLVTTSPTNGTIYKLLDTVYYDGVDKVYSMNLKSKDFNFDMPHHRKKIKEYQLITKIQTDTRIMVSLFADNNFLVSQALSYDPNQNSDSQKLKVMASGRFRYVKTEITIPVVEFIQLIGFGFIFKENTPK